MRKRDTEGDNGKSDNSYSNRRKMLKLKAY